jgi:membrane protease YdiL (CAAX protease family)
VLACAGQVYGWLGQVGGSIYPAVLTHVAFNFGLGVAVLCATTEPVEVLGAVLSRPISRVASSIRLDPPAFAVDQA